MKGFDLKWCEWIQNFTMKGRVVIKVNNDIGYNLKSQKGLRQGYPLSAILFNILAEMLAILINRAKEYSQVSGLIPNLVDAGSSIFNFYDTILFMEHDFEKNLNMKFVLCVFEKNLSPKINFCNSEIFCFGKAKEVENDYKVHFGCDIGSLQN
jgi:hypothetical protein